MGTLFFFDVGQEVGLFKYPACDYDDTVGAPLEDHMQRAIEELPLGLRIDHEGKVAGRAQTGLDSAHDGDAEGVGEIESQNPDGLRAASAQRSGIGIGMIAELLGDGPNVFAGCCGHVLRQRRVAKDDGNGRDRETAGASDIEQRYVTRLTLAQSGSFSVGPAPELTPAFAGLFSLTRFSARPIFSQRFVQTFESI